MLKTEKNSERPHWSIFLLYKLARKLYKYKIKSNMILLFDCEVFSTLDRK